MAAKLVVTANKGGSRIALVGSSGTELLTSKVFSEPRAKGATLRSLKGLLGDDIVIEDHTATAVAKATEAPTAPAPKVGRSSNGKAKAETATAPAAKVSTAKAAPKAKRPGRRKAAV